MSLYQRMQSNRQNKDITAHSLDIRQVDREREEKKHLLCMDGHMGYNKINCIRNEANEMSLVPMLIVLQVSPLKLMSYILTLIN